MAHNAHSVHFEQSYNAHSSPFCKGYMAPNIDTATGLFLKNQHKTWGLSDRGTWI